MKMKHLLTLLILIALSVVGYAQQNPILKLDQIQVTSTYGISQNPYPISIETFNQSAPKELSFTDYNRQREYFDNDLAHWNQQHEVNFGFQLRKQKDNYFQNQSLFVGLGFQNSTTSSIGYSAANYTRVDTAYPIPNSYIMLLIDSINQINQTAMHRARMAYINLAFQFNTPRYGIFRFHIAPGVRLGMSFQSTFENQVDYYIIQRVETFNGMPPFQFTENIQSHETENYDAKGPLVTLFEPNLRMGFNFMLAKTHPFWSRINIASSWMIGASFTSVKDAYNRYGTTNHFHLAISYKLN
jgi:hypothetical protein